ncbi:MAG: helix-turn-helix domain-containing protein [Eggerthellaceae bacterium]
MLDERMTEDLLKKLLASPTPQDYIDEGLTTATDLSTYLFALLDERDIKRADVAKAAGINGTVVYDIFGGKSKPGRDRAIMLAFGLSCTFKETQRILRLAGVSELWPKNRRDAIIAWCINQGMTRAQCDDELWKLGEKTLLGTGALR